MSRFDELMNGIIGNSADSPQSDHDGETLGELWARIRKMQPATALVAAPLLFATAGIAILGLLAAAIFGAVALVLLESLIGAPERTQKPAATVH